MDWLKNLINWLCQPSILFTIATIVFFAAMKIGALWT